MNALSRLALIIVVPLLIAFMTYRFMRSSFLAPLDSNNKDIVLVEVEADKNFREICKLLQDKGVINHWWSLEILARLRKNDHSIAAGEYELSPSMDPREVLAKLASGEVYKRKVAVKEGMSVWEIGAVVDKAGLMSQQDFDNAIADPRLLAEAGISAPSFEGYMYPETYNFSRPINARAIIWRMLEEGEVHWPAEFSARADELQYSRHEILTLASIIEKEAGNADEQALISSVFHNRLSQGMKLQSEATVAYGIPNFKGTLSKEDLQTPTPYNTFMNFGLPPGPIGNPGEISIRAALYPRDSTYLFFVSDGNGKHVFSTTLQEHKEAVALYQGNKKEVLEAQPPAGSPAP
ncbi:MAG: endolytic transglycosylase MltG [Deltaproteobacteria bacterium]|nr:endolytic transglycosylase MltG [Deltaproteobacteria bacterium]